MAVYRNRENAFILKTTTTKKALVLCAFSKESRDRWWNEILRAGCHVVGSVDEVMQDREDEDEDEEEEDDVAVGDDVDAVAALCCDPG